MSRQVPSEETSDPAAMDARSALKSLAGSKGVSDEARYAIYYTPPAGHALTRHVSDWLGRNAFQGAGKASAVGAGVDAVISEPRRYGFHATLKAPFRLAGGCTSGELEEALRQFSKKTWPCPIGPLRIDIVRGFLALVPRSETPRLQAFASSIVEAFDRFRAPLNAEELHHRLDDPLDDEEASHLVRWGYPYVFDRFKFHLTLTNKIEAPHSNDVALELRRRLGALLDEDYRMDRLTLFEQSAPGLDFVVRREFDIRR